LDALIERVEIDLRMRGTNGNAEVKQEVKRSPSVEPAAPLLPRDWSSGDWGSIGSFGSRADIDLNKLMAIANAQERLALAIRFYGEKDGHRLLEELDALSRAKSPFDVRAKPLASGTQFLRNGFSFLYDEGYYRIGAHGTRRRLVFQWIQNARDGKYFRDVDFVDYKTT
jgi:hypothetical protein